MTDKQQEKYVNMLLAELYERALNYSKKAFSTSARISGRERSANHVLAEEFCKVYNIAIGLIGPLGTSDIAKSQKIVWSRQFREDFEMLDEAGIEEIVYKAYKTSGQERQSVRTREYKRTIDYLNKHPQLAAEILNAVDSVAKSTSRLNAKRGGLVRHYMHDKGLSAQEARARAQEDIDNELINKRAKHLASKDINSLLEDQGLPNDNSYDREGQSGPANNSSILDLLGPAQILEEIHQEREAALDKAVENGDYYVGNIDNISSSSDDFSIFDAEDPAEIEQKQMGSQFCIDKDIGTENKLNPTQQLIASGSAAEVTARALLAQAGIKPKKGINR